MSYFFDLEYSNQEGVTVQQKGRVYKVLNRKGEFSYYEIAQHTVIDGEKFASAAFACFDPDLWRIPQEDRDRALTRFSKAA